MGMSAVVPGPQRLRGLTASLLYHPHTLPLLLTSSSIALRPFAQQRTLHWWGRCRSSDWHLGVDARFQDLMKKGNRLFLYKYAWALRRQPSSHQDAGHNRNQQRWSLHRARPHGTCGKAGEDRLSSWKMKEPAWNQK